MDGIEANKLDKSEASSTYAPGVSVMAYGAVRDGATLDTAAINATIQANPGRDIYLPNGPLGVSIYLVDADSAAGQSILLNVPGTRLILDSGVTIKVKTNALDRYAAIIISAADCSVIGGALIGDVGTHTGTTGEWGHGVAIYEAAHRAKVDGVHISKMWGDGICVGDTGVAYSTGAKPADCLFQNVIADDNRRQGISLVSALRPKIIGGSYLNTGLTAFTAPGAGIAIEPNSGGLQDVIDVDIIGPITQANKGRGMYVNPGGRTVSGVATAVRALGNLSDGISTDGAVTFEFNGCVANGNTGQGFTQATTAAGADINFNGCKANGNTVQGFVLNTGATATGCRATNNGMSGFYLTGAAAANACTAKGNNQTSTYYGQIGIDGGTAVQVTGCVSDAGSNTTKPNWGYQIEATSSATVLIGCQSVGAFNSGLYYDAGTGTNALPKPGAVKQTGTPAAATDAATTMALVNDLRTKLLALGHIN